jgi:hypothetical protein
LLYFVTRKLSGVFCAFFVASVMSIIQRLGAGDAQLTHEQATSHKYERTNMQSKHQVKRGIVAA